MRRGKRRSHILKAYWRDTWILLRQFRHSLFAFTFLLLLGALWLMLFYTEKRLDFGEAIYATLMLVFLNPTLDFPQSGFARPAFFLVPIVGVGIFTEAIIRFGILLFAKSYREEEWQRVMASTYRNHTIIVGIGRVGYRVAEELLNAGEEIAAVTLADDEESAYLIRKLRDKGVPVIVDDARRTEVLKDAQIEHARCLLICTGNDLTNLEIALAAREVNPNIRIVMRLFSDALAERAQKFLGVQAALSTSAIAAPAMVAAAISQTVAHAFYVGEHLFHVAEVNLDENNPLVGLTVGELERQSSVSVILLRHSNGELVHLPPADLTLRPNDTLVLVGTPEQIALLRTEKFNADIRKGR
ncbi:MAG: TrkA family potassium uptake protein [Armatimonadota bacterium]|nr:TrkA family potassium uptake protein [Armatimonadota bacterium]MDW8144212.1 TrkA family potassium uptake protein [Armatimonadota bacterium]